jgi:tetrapyrrole methylase family protein/MazG family protein
MQYSEREKVNSFEKLVKTIAFLRSPDGCAWDRAQDLQSVKRLLLDEVYEAIQAIEDNDLSLLAEELGDLLVLLIFSALLASEKDAFSLDDVISSVIQKIYRRHPHVFGSEKAYTPQEAKESWNRIKRKEKKGSFLLDQVPKSSPALSFSQLLQERAANVGFDWDSSDQVVMKLNEELKEFADSSSMVERNEELGDVLFTVVNLARKYDIHAETALRQSATKFVRRFEAMCELAQLRQLNFEKLSMDAKNTLWEEVKIQEGDDSDKAT